MNERTVWSPSEWDDDSEPVPLPRIQSTEEWAADLLAANRVFYGPNHQETHAAAQYLQQVRDQAEAKGTDS